MEILLFLCGAWEKCLLVAIPRNCIYHCDHVIGSLVKQEGFSEVIPSHWAEGPLKAFGFKDSFLTITCSLCYVLLDTLLIGHTLTAVWMLELGSSFSFNKKATVDLGIEIHRNSLESCISDITKKYQPTVQ